VTLIYKIVGPARPPVRCFEQGDVGLTASGLHEQDWIRMLALLRHPHLEIHGAPHPFLARSAHPLAADIKMALASDFFGRKSWHRCQSNRDRGIVAAQSERIADQN